MATIVVVDDDEDMRMLVEFKLRRLGHEVVAACDGREGLDACRRLSPDLAVVDVNMPVMTGLELLRALRGSIEHRDLPVPGRELGGVLQAMDYLPHANRAALDPAYLVPVSAAGKHVIIIGGGDTGADEHRGGFQGVLDLVLQ